MDDIVDLFLVEEDNEKALSTGLHYMDSSEVF